MPTTTHPRPEDMAAEAYPDLTGKPSRQSRTFHAGARTAYAAGVDAERKRLLREIAPVVSLLEQWEHDDGPDAEVGLIGRAVAILRALGPLPYGNRARGWPLREVHQGAQALRPLEPFGLSCAVPCAHTAGARTRTAKI